jgi:aspartate kinase
VPVVVQKFGGSSVADPTKIRAVADRVAATRASGKGVVVVVSAMGDTTDDLLRLAHQVCENPARRELDMLLTAGERISMALLSMALNARNVAAVSLTGSQSGIITNDAHANARIIEVRPYRVQDELEAGKVVIVAGYQGISYKKEVTTLGRGGSDTTAVALAAALDAESCEIYSDVEGVYSADPRVVPEAKRLAEISYEEMQELAEAGARVLNAQAVEFAKERGIAIYARATFKGPGETIVRKLGPQTAARVVGIASQKGLVLVETSVGSVASFAGLLKALDARGVGGKELVLRTPADGGDAHASLVLSLENIHDYPDLREALRSGPNRGLVLREGLGAVSAVGSGINASHENLRRAIEAVMALGTTPVGITTSSFRISLLLDETVLEKAARALHQALVEPLAAS